MALVTLNLGTFAKEEVYIRAFLLLSTFVYVMHLLCYFRKMNDFLNRFENKSKLSTVSREAAAATAVTSSDSQGKYTHSPVILLKSILCLKPIW